MGTSLRIATFNLENLDDEHDEEPALEDRIPILRPQLQRLRADVLCLQEVHGQETGEEPRELLALEKLLEGTRYEHQHEIVHTHTTADEAYDRRNLVVVSRLPVLRVEQLRNDRTPGPAYRKVTADPPDEEASEVRWQRPILHVALEMADGRTLHVLNLHLKSKIPTEIEGQLGGWWPRKHWKSAAAWAEGAFVSAMKRVGQALEARILVDDIFDEAEARGEDALIAVCGDLNAEGDQLPVQALCGPVEATGNPDLVERVLIPCERAVAASNRYTLLHLGKGVMLDHILVSRALLEHFRGAEIHNEVLPDESGKFRTDVKFPESDHAPVVAEFDV